MTWVGDLYVLAETSGHGCIGCCVGVVLWFSVLFVIFAGFRVFVVGFIHAGYCGLVRIFSSRWWLLRHGSEILWVCYLEPVLFLWFRLFLGRFIL